MRDTSVEDNDRTGDEALTVEISDAAMEIAARIDGRALPVQTLESSAANCC